MGEDLKAVDKNKMNPKPKGVFFKSTIIGAIITVPSLTAFFISWFLTGEKITSAIIGIVVHFIGMGFSLKLARRLFKVPKS